MRCYKCNATTKLTQLSGGLWECTYNYYCGKSIEDYFIIRQGIRLDSYSFVTCVEEYLTDEDKNIIKNLYNNNIELLKCVIIDAYDDYMEWYEEIIKKRQEQIIQYCIETDIIIPRESCDIKHEDFSGSESIHEESQVEKRFCKGHVAEYRRNCCVYCASCNKWIDDWSGFYHCCCYYFRGKPII